MNPTSPPEHRVAIAGGIELAYDSFGDPNDEPLLLIMGLASQMLVWDDGFCAALAARGFYVVRYDNRDVGRSTVLAEAGIPDIGAMMKRALAGEAVTAPYTLADMAGDGLALLDALGIASAHIVGASMGGAIAQEIAMSHPARVRTLVSIMASSGDPGSSRRRRSSRTPTSNAIARCGRSCASAPSPRTRPSMPPVPHACTHAASTRPAPRASSRRCSRAVAARRGSHRCARRRS